MDTDNDIHLPICWQMMTDIIRVCDCIPGNDGQLREIALQAVCPACGGGAET